MSNTPYQAFYVARPAGEGQEVPPLPMPAPYPFYSPSGSVVMASSFSQDVVTPTGAHLALSPRALAQPQQPAQPLMVPMAHDASFSSSGIYVPPPLQAQPYTLPTGQVVYMAPGPAQQPQAPMFVAPSPTGGGGLPTTPGGTMLYSAVPMAAPYYVYPDQQASAQHFPMPNTLSSPLSAVLSPKLPTVGSAYASQPTQPLQHTSSILSNQSPSYLPVPLSAASFTSPHAPSQPQQPTYILMSPGQADETNSPLSAAYSYVPYTPPQPHMQPQPQQPTVASPNPPMYAMMACGSPLQSPAHFAQTVPPPSWMAMSGTPPQQQARPPPLLPRFPLVTTDSSALHSPLVMMPGVPVPLQHQQQHLHAAGSPHASYRAVDMASSPSSARDRPGAQQQQALSVSPSTASVPPAAEEKPTSGGASAGKRKKGNARTGGGAGTAAAAAPAEIVSGVKPSPQNSEASSNSPSFVQGLTFAEDPVDIDTTKDQLIVNYLPQKLTREQFFDLFRQYGEIDEERSRIIYDFRHRKTVVVPSSAPAAETATAEGVLATPSSLEKCTASASVSVEATASTMDISSPTATVTAGNGEDSTTTLENSALSASGGPRGLPRSKGYGFIYYRNGASTELAIKELNGREIEGKRIKVRYAEQQRNPDEKGGDEDGSVDPDEEQKASSSVAAEWTQSVEDCDGAAVSIGGAILVPADDE